MKSPYQLNKDVAKAYNYWDVGKNKAAFRLFLNAAKKGDQLAYNIVGYFYDHGIGVIKNQDMAIYWYRRAARIGDAISFYNLGLCYLNLANFNRARFWLKKAAASGDEDAREKLDALNR